MVSGQEKSSSASAVDETEIKDFKDKIASKVAELEKKDQRAFTGFIVKNEKTQITLKTEDKTNLQVKIDDILTKIYKISGATKKEIQIEDLTKDDYIIVTGPINDTVITANEIYVDERYLVKVGRVTEVNKTDYSLKVMTAEKEEYLLDIETQTRQLMLNIKTLEFEKAGFSKIKEGDLVHFVVKKAEFEQKDNHFSGAKILIILRNFLLSNFYID
jgi:hypothetical protein